MSPSAIQQNNPQDDYIFPNNSTLSSVLRTRHYMPSVNPVNGVLPATSSAPVCCCRRKRKAPVKYKIFVRPTPPTVDHNKLSVAISKYKPTAQHFFLNNTARAQARAYVSDLAKQNTQEAPPETQFNHIPYTNAHTQPQSPSSQAPKQVVSSHDTTRESPPMPHLRRIASAWWHILPNQGTDDLR